jgi:hypothetical protein
MLHKIDPRPAAPKCVAKRRCKVAYGINPYDISV